MEGPSDRVYLKAWLGAARPDLKEGVALLVHVLWGRLLSQLAVTDVEVDEFIDLQRLNRHVVVLMDSDRESEEEQLSKTKNRLINETKILGEINWVTAGREIENYIENSTMAKALQHIHMNMTFVRPKNQWPRACKTKGKSQAAQIDQLRVARFATENINLDVLDLRERIEQLIEYILTCNEEVRC